MQDHVIDRLTSKHISATSRLAGLPRLIGGHLTHRPIAKAVTEKSSVSPAVAQGSVEHSYIYAGTMTMSGDLHATPSEQNGTWSGTLHDKMYVTMDSAGNGTAYEVFTGSIKLHVVNPDGSSKDQTSPFNFTINDISLTKGHFSISQQEGNPISLSLSLTTNLAGSFGASQATISENLHSPFNGFLSNGALVDGQINGLSTVTVTTPLTMSGIPTNQRTYAARSVQPFKTISITDLTGLPVTAVMIVSNSANGTLSAPNGGSYNKFTGVYTITGSAASVNHALNGLTFNTAGNLGSPTQPVTTGFTISVTDSGGHTLAKRTTSVVAIQPLSIAGIVSNQITTGKKTDQPFHSVTIGDLSAGEVDFVTITLSNPGSGTLSNLGSGSYNKKAGSYVIEATAAKATAALRGLEFTPAGTAAAVKTTFTISVRNPAGASVINGNTTVTATTKAADNKSLALFSQYVAAGFHIAPDHAVGIAAVNDPSGVTHLALAASHG